MVDSTEIKKAKKPIKRLELITYGEVHAGDWKFLFGEQGHDCMVFFKGHEIRGVHSVHINATAGHFVTMNIELIPMLVKDYR